MSEVQVANRTFDLFDGDHLLCRSDCKRASLEG